MHCAWLSRARPSSTSAARSACPRRRTMLKYENAWLKRIVADLTLDKLILQEVVRKKR